MRLHRWTFAAAAGAAALAVVAGQAPAQAPAAPAAPAQAAPAQAKPAAVVNGEAIPLVAVEAVLNRGGPQAVQVPEAKLREMRYAAVGMLVDDILLQQYLRQNGPRVDAAEVQKQFEELVGGLKKQGKTVQDFCKETGETEAQLKQDIVNMLQWRDYVKARITDTEVKRYYDENKDFFDGIMVRASHIVLRLAPDATDADKQAARTKLLGLRQEIVSGKLDFAEAAKKHSQCPSAPQGGDLNFFPRKFVVEENFARAAFALQVGQVSDIVQTDFGLHLIKVTERKPGTPSDFAKIKDDVREFCVMDLRQGVLLQQRKASKIEINLP